MKIFLFFAFIISSFSQDQLKIHIIPHSHQDPGWLTTIEGYYTGSTAPFGECVKCVIERVFESLKNDKNLVFTWAEMAFLFIWHKSATDAEKLQFGEFLKTKQIDFVNGGYVTNDEACSHYEDIIEQLTYGNRFLKSHYGFIPTTAWHIDPFGHSGTVASIFSQAGFKSFFIERSNEEEMNERAKNTTLEFIWDPSGSGNYIFTHYNYLKYGGLDATGYCLTSLCNSWQQDLNKMANWFIEQNRGYPSNRMLLHVGKDFSFGFNNDVQLFTEINDMISKFNGLRVGNYIFEVFLSNPTNYTKDFFENYEKNGNVRLTVRENDNFPYIEKLGYTSRYWTGYFSSRPQIKLIMRQSGFLLQTYRKIFGQFFLQSDFEEFSGVTYFQATKGIDDLEQAVSLAQHHDGISGTAKSWVERDYVDKLFNARQELNFFLSRIYTNLTNLTSSTFMNCPQNISFYQCNNSKLLDTQKLMMKVFNPGGDGWRIVKAKIPHGNIKYVGENRHIEPDIFCFDSIYGDKDCEIVFEDHFNLAETKTYLLEYSDKDSSIPHQNYNNKSRIEAGINSWIEIEEFEPIKLKFKLCEGRSCIEDSLSFDYFGYKSNGDSAYILMTTEAEPTDFTQFESYDVYTGKTYSYIIFNDSKNKVKARIAMNLKNPKSGIKVTSELAPLRLDGYPYGAEIILRVKTDIQSEGKFVTDGNSLLLNRRKRNYDSSDVNNVAKNYFPVNSQISIEDGVRKLVLMCDRSQGGSSTRDGELELMIHRRVMSTGQGIGEYLDDYEPGTQDPIKVTTEHTILMVDPSSSDESIRQVQFLNESPLFIMYGLIHDPTYELIDNPLSPVSTISLPRNLKFSIRSFSKHEFMIRFINLNEKNEVSYQFNSELFGLKINNLLTSLSYNKFVQVINNEEVSINTIHKKSDLKLQEFREIKAKPIDPRSLSTDSLFFSPLQIRTFMVTVAVTEAKHYSSDDFRMKYLYKEVSKEGNDL